MKRPATTGAARRALGPAATVAVAALLTACMGEGDAPAAWAAAAAFITVVALLVVAAGAHAIGRLRERNEAGRALRAAHARARELAALQSDIWLWQTDAAHALVSWQGPGAFDPAALFADAALQSRLRTQQAFAGLRVALAQPLAGSCGWELRAVACQDDAGAFAGHHGAARPTDAADAERAASRAMEAVLATHTGAALLAVAASGGWRVHAHNPAARAVWKDVAPGMALRLLTAALPPAARSAVDQAMAGSTARAEADGWAVIPCGGVDARSLLLLRPPAAAPAADAAASAESDQFSFTVSHDLRAPIRVVEGFTRIVKEDYGKLLDRVGNDHLDRVLGAATRMNLMIDALLTLARLSSQPLARQPVNLSQLAGYVVDDLRRAAPERSVDVEIQPELKTQGDPTLLRMVLENLLGNAWKYTARVARAQISLRSVPHGAGFAYVVRDNGAGFDMRSAERLFGLFQRLHSASEFAGHGVGLASVRRIVRRHGGDVWAEAEPGKGAAFYFTLAG